MKRLDRVGEIALIRWIKEHMAESESPASAVRAGIGDDAAVIRTRGVDLLASTDAMVENIHFDLTLETPYQVGFRSVVASVSDVRAMGGTPTALLVTLGAPAETGFSTIQEMYQGIRAATEQQRVQLAGGDTVGVPRDIFISVSVLGESSTPVLRSGAHTNDGLFLSGTVGESALGLHLLKRLGTPVPLERGLSPPDLGGVAAPVVGRFIRRHVLPELPPVPVGAGAMIDISDGLLMDASRIAEASGVGIRIETDRIPVAREFRALCRFLGYDPLDMALCGGEDYALLFTLPPGSPCPANAIRIGSVVESGLLLASPGAPDQTFSPDGWEHFRAGGTPAAPDANPSS